MARSPKDDANYEFVERAANPIAGCLQPITSMLKRRLLPAQKEKADRSGRRE